LATTDRIHKVAIAPDQVRDTFEKNVPGSASDATAGRTPDDSGIRKPMPGFSTSSLGCRSPMIRTHENVIDLDADDPSISASTRR